MHAIVGPILLKEGCYTFDLWTAEEGLSRGYAYRRVEDAHYARNAEIRSRRRGRSGLQHARRVYFGGDRTRGDFPRPGHEPRSQAAQSRSSPRTPPPDPDRGRPRSIVPLTRRWGHRLRAPRATP